ERFTRGARDVVEGAVRHAERRGAPEIGADHLLLAVVDAAGTRAAELLSRHALTPQDVATEITQAGRRAGLSEEEVGALRELGIDVNDVVQRIELVHGAGALGRKRSTGGRHRRFTPEAKAVLTRALREATDLRDRHIDDEHLLLALAALPGVPSEILADYGLSYDVLRARVARAS
ncbi:MAG: Clp protease N-terminal domain-containing protein, partial [Thermocrispum sp.]